MIVDDELNRDAQQLAGRALEGRSEHESWELFRHALEFNAGAQRAGAVNLLAIEMIAEALYPEISREQWRKLGWNDALSGRMSPQAFIHKLRLAKAAGSKTGRI